MEKLNRRILYRLKNLEVAGYAQEVVEATGLLDAVTEVSLYVERLRNSVEAYSGYVYQETTEDYTEDIHRICASVENAWEAVWKISDGFRYSLDTQVSQTAKRVYDVVAKAGDISRMTYDGKFGYIVGFLSHVTDGQSAMLSIAPFVETLRSGNEQYLQVTAARKDYRKQRKARTWNLRRAMVRSIVLLYDLVENLAEFGGEDMYAAFASRISELQRERARIIAEAKAAKKQTAVPATDAVQAEESRADDADSDNAVPDTAAEEPEDSSDIES